MMDALISVFVKRLKDTLNAVDRDEVDSRITGNDFLVYFYYILSKVRIVLIS